MGEIVGRCGIGVIKYHLKTFRENNNIDFVIANGEGATGGFGLGFSNAQSLRHMGIDVLTLGEKAFFKIDMTDALSRYDRVLRPANYPEDAPGRGIRHFSVGDKRVCVINILGMLGFNNPHLNNPFLAIEKIVEKAKAETPYVFVIFHSQATAEKITMGHLLDGKASAVIGTHTKILTGDATVLENRTAYISDIGRCGSSESVGGFDPSGEIKKYSTGLFVRSRECWKKPQLQGLVATFDESGLCTELETVRLDVDVSPMESKY